MAFKSKELLFEEKLYYPVKFKTVNVGKSYFDFLVEHKVVVEIKSSERFIKAHFDQLLNYLIISNTKLGILVAFGRTEVKFKRILNIELLNKEKLMPHS